MIFTTRLNRWLRLALVGSLVICGCRQAPTQSTHAHRPATPAQPHSLDILPAPASEPEAAPAHPRQAPVPLAPAVEHLPEPAGG